MTCKEFAHEYYPELTEPEMFCPFTFGLSVKDYKDGCFSDCHSCWNQPAKHHGKWIMKVKVIK